MVPPNGYALQSWEGAVNLWKQAPPPDTPCRALLSNLGHFLHTRSVPVGASYAENVLDLQLLQRMDAAGELKQGELEQIEQEFRRAMESQD